MCQKFKYTLVLQLCDLCANIWNKAQQSILGTEYLCYVKFI